MIQTMVNQPQATDDALRTHLDTLERLTVDPTPDTVEELLVTLDAAEAEIEVLEANNVDLGEERTRWDTIVQNVTMRPQLIAVPARGFPGGMAALRASHGEAHGIWWQADRLRAESLRNQLIRAVVLLLIAAGVMLGAGWVWSNFFAPEPTALLFAQPGVWKVIGALWQ